MADTLTLTLKALETLSLEVPTRHGFAEAHAGAIMRASGSPGRRETGRCMVAFGVMYY